MATFIRVGIFHLSHETELGLSFSENQSKISPSELGRRGGELGAGGSLSEVCGLKPRALWP